MAKRDSFLIRVDPQVLEALRRWADDEMRSVNGQVEYLLRNALQTSGRLPTPRGQRELDAPPGKPEFDNDQSDESGPSPS